MLRCAAKNEIVLIYSKMTFELSKLSCTELSDGRTDKFNKMLSCRRETALQGTLVFAESGRLELRDNMLLIL